MSGWLSAGLGWANSAEGWIALGTLTVLEIVLGIDNIVFISILAGKLRQEDRARARKVGLSLAMIIRILLLLSITWVMGLTQPLFTVPIADRALSGTRHHGPGSARWLPLRIRTSRDSGPASTARSVR